MTILILGSSGQIGSALCNLYEQKHISYKKCDLVDGLEFDLRSPSSFLEGLFSKASFVHFLAFDVGGSRYLSKFQNSYEFLENNLLIMNTCFSLLRKFEVPFLFASTQMSNMVHSPYGTLKRMGEDFSKSLNGIPVHFWNTYGVETDASKTHVITDFLIQARSHNHIYCSTDGREKRQFLHADDCATALEVVRTVYKDLLLKPVHITSHIWTSINEIANIVSDLHSNCPISYSDHSDPVQHQILNSPDPFFLNYWSPSISLVEGISKVKDSLSK